MNEPPAFDVTIAARGMTDLEGLVRDVIAAEPENETDWIEWKSSLDLLIPRDRFAIAKRILGFSNRDPIRAAKYMGGLLTLSSGRNRENFMAWNALLTVSSGRSSWPRKRLPSPTQL